MIRVILVAMSLLVFAACKKDKDNEVIPIGGGTANNGKVIPEAIGKWLHGTFAMAQYWGYDGSYHGNPFSQSVAFDFAVNGNYEMYYTGQSNNFGCIEDAFSYFKGYVIFTDSTFTVHPQSGRFRGYYNCISNADFDRPAEASELKEQTFYYRFETDMNNKKWFVVGFKANDPNPSYFESTSW